MAVLVWGSPSRAQEPVTVLVTSPADAPGTCPSSGQCTLRGAIAFVNSSAEPDAEFLIRFSGSAFPVGGTTIELGSPLPAVVADDVTIDPFGLVIKVSGSQLPAGAADGLVLAGQQNRVRGLEFANFGGSCLLLSGARSVAGGLGANQTLHFGSCAVGITIGGSESQVLGVRIGTDREGAASSVGTGIDVQASDASIGPATGTTLGTNAIGNAAVGIRVAGRTDPLEGVLIRANLIGTTTSGQPAPTGTGIRIDHASAGVTIQDNSIANTSFGGIVVAADAGDSSVTGVSASGNTFAAKTGLPIDLRADGIIESNDPGDADTGPNGLQNHPTITRPTTSRVEGVVTDCDGCTVEIYTAEHETGAVEDRNFAPVSGMVGLTDSNGAFSIPSASLDPGSWIAAIASGPDGTSEFGPSARVGTGSVVCGSTFLVPGWNHASYLGPATALGNVFPESGDIGAVSAIYEFVDEDGTYKRWFPESGPARTLTELVPGATYWFLVDRTLVLPGGFAFSNPIAVELHEGWNDFIYLGATAASLDVLRNVRGGHGGPYRFEPGISGSWDWGGKPGAPGWAVDFSELVACRAYHIQAGAPGPLVPLQP